VKHLIILLFSIVIVSCSKESEKETVYKNLEGNKTDTLQSIQSTVKMVYIPGGEYKPFFGSNTTLVSVAPFLMDERAVTNEEFLEFVIANPQWQKSNIKRLFADTN